MKILNRGRLALLLLCITGTAGAAKTRVSARMLGRVFGVFIPATPGYLGSLDVDWATRLMGSHRVQVRTQRSRLSYGIRHTRMWIGWAMHRRIP